MPTKISMLMIIIKWQLARAWGHGPSLCIALGAVDRDQPSERANGWMAPCLRRYPWHCGADKPGKLRPQADLTWCGTDFKDARPGISWKLRGSAGLTIKHCPPLVLMPRTPSPLASCRLQWRSYAATVILWDKLSQGAYCYKTQIHRPSISTRTFAPSTAGMRNWSL